MVGTPVFSGVWFVSSHAACGCMSLIPPRASLLQRILRPLTSGARENAPTVLGKPRCIGFARLAYKRSSQFGREGRTVTTMAEPPNKTASVTVDELLGMAHDAYARARASPDASTKQKLMRLADDYLKQAKDMRRRHVILPPNR